MSRLCLQSCNGSRFTQTQSESPQGPQCSGPFFSSPTPLCHALSSHGPPKFGLRHWPFPLPWTLIPLISIYSLHWRSLPWPLNLKLSFMSTPWHSQSPFTLLYFSFSFIRVAYIPSDIIYNLFVMCIIYWWSSCHWNVSSMKGRISVCFCSWIDLQYIANYLHKIEWEHSLYLCCEWMNEWIHYAWKPISAEAPVP